MFLKLFLMILNFLFNNRYFFILVGKVNKKFNKIHSIFVAYPASEEYAKKYCFHWYERHIKWKPYIVGFMKQNGFYTIFTAISSVETDFSRHNKKQLEKLVKDVDTIKNLVGASQKSFAGILPGVLFSMRILRDTPEANITVDAVIKAEEEVRFREYLDESVPLIILGGKGFIGRKLTDALNSQNRKYYVVDSNERNSSEANHLDWPHALRGERVILINLTRNCVIVNYLGLIWSEMIVLNETYPGPSRGQLNILKERKVRAYHIVGREAYSIPSFPLAYQGGIPCCAALPSKQMEVMIKKLN